MAEHNSLRKYFHVKKLWFFSILKNRAQHEKIKTSQLLLERRIAQLEQNNSLLQKETTSLKKALTRQERRTRKLTPQPFLKLIEIHLAYGCNLKCFSCSHFSQLAPKDQFPDIDCYEKDMKRLSEISRGLVGTFHLMGGEPLLNPNCKDFFTITRRYFADSRIRLVTNRILLSKQDSSFWESCRDNRIEISPTKYPIKVDWDLVKDKCIKYDVPFKFFGGARDDKTSRKCILNLQGNIDAYGSFINCAIANNCIQLRDGKLFTCPFPAYIQFFNQKFNQNLQVTESDYIDIYKAKDYTEILQFLAKPIPFCRYCNVAKWHMLGEWKISTKVIEEYLDT